MYKFKKRLECDISDYEGVELEDDLKGDLGGNLEKLFVSLLTANRENGFDIDNDQAKEDAQRLFDVSSNIMNRPIGLQLSGSVY